MASNSKLIAKATNPKHITKHGLQQQYHTAEVREKENGRYSSKNEKSGNEFSTSPSSGGQQGIRSMIIERGTKRIRKIRDDIRGDRADNVDATCEASPNNVPKRVPIQRSVTSEKQWPLTPVTNGEVFQKRDVVHGSLTDPVKASVSSPRIGYLDRQKYDSQIINDFNKIFDLTFTWSWYFDAIDDKEDETFPSPWMSRFKEVVWDLTDGEGLKRALEDSGFKQYFVMGWVAHVLMVAVFEFWENEQVVDVWLTPNIAQDIASMEANILDNDPKLLYDGEFHDWRARTVHLLNRSEEHRKKPLTRVTEAINDAVQAVMNVVEPWHRGEPSELEGHRAQLRVIFSNAVDLAALMRSQKAYWIIRHPLRSYSEVPWPDASAFEVERKTFAVDVGENRSLQKQIALRPALYKRGDMNGNKFSVEDLMKPGRAVLFVPKNVE